MSSPHGTSSGRRPCQPTRANEIARERAATRRSVALPLLKPATLYHLHVPARRIQVGVAQGSVSQNSPRFSRMVHVPTPSAPIKVLRVITRLNIGGPAIHAILLTHALDDGVLF